MAFPTNLPKEKTLGIRVVGTGNRAWGKGLRGGGACGGRTGRGWTGRERGVRTRFAAWGEDGRVLGLVSMEQGMRDRG